MICSVIVILVLITSWGKIRHLRPCRPQRVMIYQVKRWKVYDLLGREHWFLHLRARKREWSPEAAFLAVRSRLISEDCSDTVADS